MELLLFMMSQIETLLKTSDNGCMKLRGTNKTNISIFWSYLWI